MGKGRLMGGEIIVPEPLPQPAQAHRVAIERATKAFLTELQKTLAFATHKKYRLLLKRFVAFSEKRGYVMMDQREPSDVREFRTSWGVSPQTAGCNMSIVKPFFEYCVSNKWLTEVAITRRCLMTATPLGWPPHSPRCTPS
jgi:hypothetical protein